MIIKALKVVGALLLLSYVIALGIVVDNVLFQIKPQNIASVVCCIMGFGFIADFILRLCLVKNKLYFISGYATLPISRRKMLWLSVFLNSLSIYNVLGVILLAPTLFHIVASSCQAFVFLLLILSLALFNGAVVRAIKSFEIMGKMLSGGIAIVMYALLGYGLLRSESGVIMSVDPVALLGIVLSVLVLALAIEYNSAKRMLYKSLGQVSSQHIYGGLIMQVKEYMFPLLYCIRLKSILIGLPLFIAMETLYIYSLSVKSVQIGGVNLYCWFIPALIAMPVFFCNPITSYLSNYIDGLITLKPSFVKMMLYRLHRVLSVISVIIAGIFMIITKDYLFVLSSLVFVVMVSIPIGMIENSFASKKMPYFQSVMEMNTISDYRSYLLRFGSIALLSMPFMLLQFVEYNIGCYVVLTVGVIGLLFHRHILDKTADNFWKNRYKILDGMREG